MKQRVKRIGDVYYAEYRSWFRWNRYRKMVGAGCEHWSIDIEFTSYEEANSYCCRKQIETYDVCCKGE